MTRQLPRLHPNGHPVHVVRWYEEKSKTNPGEYFSYFRLAFEIEEGIFAVPDSMKKIDADAIGHIVNKKAHDGYLEIEPGRHRRYRFAARPEAASQNKNEESNRDDKLIIILYLVNAIQNIACDDFDSVIMNIQQAQDLTKGFLDSPEPEKPAPRVMTY